MQAALSIRLHPNQLPTSTALFCCYCVPAMNNLEMATAALLQIAQAESSSLNLCTCTAWSVGEGAVRRFSGHEVNTHADSSRSLPLGTLSTSHRLNGSVFPIHS